jgi:hypothetical protein
MSVDHVAKGAMGDMLFVPESFGVGALGGGLDISI